MEIAELFDEATIKLELNGTTKDEIIDEMVELTKKNTKKPFMQEKSSQQQD